MCWVRAGLGSGTKGKMGRAWVGAWGGLVGAFMDDVEMMWWGWEKCSGILPGMVRLDLSIGEVLFEW